MTLSSQSDHCRRGLRYPLSAIFFVTALWASVTGAITTMSGQAPLHVVSTIGLGFLSYCMLCVASGRRGLGSKLSLSAGVFFVSLALLAAGLNPREVNYWPHAGQPLASNGTLGDSQTSIVYDANTGELAVDAPSESELTSINIDSATGIFRLNDVQNLGGSYDNLDYNNVFKFAPGSSFGFTSFGIIALPKLSQEYVRYDLHVIGSLVGGGGLGDVDVVYIPLSKSTRTTSVFDADNTARRQDSAAPNRLERGATVPDLVN